MLVGVVREPPAYEPLSKRAYASETLAATYAVFLRAKIEAYSLA